MVGIIVAGHGQFASGLISAARLLLGDPPVLGVDFSGESAEALERDMDRAVGSFPEGQPLLILCDLKGGTPFRTAVMRTRERDNTWVLYGVNLDMLIEVCMSCNDSVHPEGGELSRKLVALGKNQMDVFELG